jgi:hypothetical protein
VHAAVRGPVPGRQSRRVEGVGEVAGLDLAFCIHTMGSGVGRK